MATCQSADWPAPALVVTLGPRPTLVGAIVVSGNCHITMWALVKVAPSPTSRGLTVGWTPLAGLPWPLAPVAVNLQPRSLFVSVALSNLCGGCQLQLLICLCVASCTVRVGAALLLSASVSAVTHSPPATTASSCTDGVAEHARVACSGRHPQRRLRLTEPAEMSCVTTKIGRDVVCPP